MPEMNLRRPGFTHSACRPFTKSRETIQKFKETVDSRYISQNQLEKGCLIKLDKTRDLPRKTASNKVLFDKALK